MRDLITVLGAFGIYSTVQGETIVQSIAVSLWSQPWWLYFLIAGIVFSGYKAYEGMKEDKKVDESFIEEEGNVFIRRMEEERKRRQMDD